MCIPVLYLAHYTTSITVIAIRTKISAIKHTDQVSRRNFYIPRNYFPLHLLQIRQFVFILRFYIFQGTIYIATDGHRDIRDLIHLTTHCKRCRIPKTRTCTLRKEEDKVITVQQNIVSVGLCHSFPHIPTYSL
jgi:hypothetical protein